MTGPEAPRRTERRSAIRSAIAGTYRLALLAYPPGFRRRFGSAMLADASELLEATGSGSTVPAARRIFGDLLRSVPREWMRPAGAGRMRLPRRGVPPGGEPPAGTGVLEDLRAALRSLVREPRVSVGIIVLMAAGIGAATLVFSVVSAYALRALPYPEADRLVAIAGSIPVLADEVGDLFEIPVTWDLDVFTLLDEETPELVSGAWVSPGYVPAFGLDVAIGRPFVPEEFEPGGDAVAIISHALWQRRYGGDPAIVGRTVQSFTTDRPEDAEQFTIVGVADPGVWHYHRYQDFLTPLRSPGSIYAGRLRAGLSLAEVGAQLHARAVRRMERVPDDFRVRLQPLQERYIASLRPVFAIGIATVLLALAIACGNTAALLLVRGSRREREFAIRQALGAGRTRMARQLLAEGLLLTLVAGALGVAVATVGLDLTGEALQRQLGRQVPGGLAALHVDGRALAVALTLTVVTGTVFGLAPLAGALRAGGASGLSAGGRSSTTGLARRRSLSWIVAGGVALSFSLLAPTVLALRSVHHLSGLQLGFEPGGVFSGPVLLRSASYSRDVERAEFFLRLASALERIPTVRAAGIGTALPFGGGSGADAARGIETDAGGQVSVATARGVTLTVDAGWFEALGVPLLLGRSFSPDDVPGSEPVALIDQQLAAALWPGQDPLGKRLRMLPWELPAMAAEPEPWLRVVGVVAPVRMEAEDTGAGNVYTSMSQFAGNWARMVLRVEGAVPPLGEIKTVLRSLDPAVAFSEPAWLSDSVAAAGQPARFLATFLGGFALVAVAIALFGLYAVLSFAAAQRHRDLAIRVALGARREQIVRLFLGQGMALVAAGLAAGVAGATFLNRALAAQLYGVDALDATVWAASAATIGAVGALASWLPGRRASAADPVSILRSE